VNEGCHPESRYSDSDTFMYSKTKIALLSKFKKYTADEFLEVVLGPDNFRFKPVRGERVLVSDNLDSDRKEAIFLADLGNTESPIRTVYQLNLSEYQEGRYYETLSWNYVLRLPGIKYECDKCDGNVSKLGVSGSITGRTNSNIIQNVSSYSSKPVNRRRILG